MRPSAFSRSGREQLVEVELGDELVRAQPAALLDRAQEAVSVAQTGRGDGAHAPDPNRRARTSRRAARARAGARSRRALAGQDGPPGRRAAAVAVCGGSCGRGLLGRRRPASAPRASPRRAWRRSRPASSRARRAVAAPRLRRGRGLRPPARPSLRRAARASARDRLRRRAPASQARAAWLRGRGLLARAAGFFAAAGFGRGLRHRRRPASGFGGRLRASPRAWARRGRVLRAPSGRLGGPALVGRGRRPRAGLGGLRPARALAFARLRLRAVADLGAAGAPGFGAPTASGAGEASGWPGRDGGCRPRPAAASLPATSAALLTTSAAVSISFFGSDGIGHTVCPAPSAPMRRARTRRRRRRAPAPRRRTGADQPPSGSRSSPRTRPPTGRASKCSSSSPANRSCARSHAASTSASTHGGGELEKGGRGRARSGTSGGLLRGSQELAPRVIGPTPNGVTWGATPQGPKRC